MTKWRIIDGPHKRPGSTVDGELWVATVENRNDPAQRRHVEIVLSRTARDSRDLPSDVRRLLTNGGAAALERFLDDHDPPKRILVSTQGVSVSE